VSVLNAAQRLARIDWNFPNAGNTRGSVHTLHWFPGNYIPQIPAALIQVLSMPGDLVLDPFGGSGTTAVEALRLNRRVMVCDRMSASVLITRAKLALLEGALDRRRRGALLADLTFEQRCRSDQFGKNGEGADPELNNWFAPDTLAQLRFLWQLVEAADTGQTRQVLEVLFSDVLFDCAAPGSALTSSGRRRRHHWGWVADNVKPREFAAHNAIGLFRQRLMALDEVPVRIGEPIGDSALVTQQDARSLALPDAVVDLVVTSPPYIGVIDYTHANRLLYTWMGWSMRLEREHEIGARFRRTRVNAVAEYKSNMRRARDELHRVLRPGGACAIVIGESKRFPGTALEILGDFAQLMPMVWGPVPRLMSRRRVSDRASSDPIEYVCVFRKP
jgi:hypothetical protein